TEARDDAGEQLGEERLHRLLADPCCTAAEATVAAVAAAVEDQVAGSRHEADDMALLALTVSV
ncbi:MAG: SpoIIE family protein phosphatase, partial [Blastococcus sp.]|nr:SpoIIE family protein phosphatase [Blastococcus sp.]